MHAAAAVLASLPAAALAFSCGDLATCTTNPCNAVGPAGTQIGHCYGSGSACDCMRFSETGERVRIANATVQFSCGDLATCTTNPCNAVGPAGTQIGHCYGVGSGCDCMRITEGGERVRIADATVAFKEGAKVADLNVAMKA